MVAPDVSERSSQWSITGSPKPRAYSSARRITRALATDGRERAWRLANSVLNALLVSTGVLVAVAIVFGAEPIVVHCDRELIAQAVVNLVKNAIEAIKDGEVANGAVRVLTRVDLEGAIEVSVLDNGPGFSAEAAQRAFDAFYTTKAHGLGMGLSICRSIVESCGGRIWLEPPGAGKGASFHFRLPAGKAKGETP